MMMPANYSAIAENEVIYGGASLLDTIGDSLPAVWTTANVRTFSNNIVKIVSNTFTGLLVNATLGTMFGGSWGKDGMKLFGSDGTFSNLLSKQRVYKNGKFDSFGDDMTTLNKFMTVLGIASSVYTLGTADAKVSFNKNVTGIKG